jgi:hypothetical protein
MARTIATIKAELTHKFLSSQQIQSAYGLTEKDVDKFETTFSTLSLESIFFYVVAASIWTLEKLFDAHKAEVTDIIATLTPHTLQWYATKAKRYQPDEKLVTDCDYYDNTGLTDAEISAKEIVTLAAALEVDYSVFLKIAKGDIFTTTTTNGIATTAVTNRKPLTKTELVGFKSYINRIKDAGVNLQVINEDPDVLYACITIYYDPLVLSDQGVAGGKNVIKECILNFIQNLPFNGELRIKALEDALAEVEGVVMPEVRGAAALSVNQKTPQAFTPAAYAKPYSGYFVINQNDIYILKGKDTVPPSKEPFPTSYSRDDKFSIYVNFVEYVTVQN